MRRITASATIILALAAGAGWSSDDDGSKRTQSASATFAVECDTFESGPECRRGDGTVVAEDIDYRDGVWYWDGEAISEPGVFPEEDDGRVVWNYYRNAPMVVGS